ncbi:MAG: hypothetical protein HGA53_09035 [Anaerolineaceae bacterium]|nr:hypothetical protein [Anaerolineaceae bacterium]
MTDQQNSPVPSDGFGSAPQMPEPQQPPSQAPVPPVPPSGAYPPPPPTSPYMPSHKHRDHNGNWIAGFVLVALGVVFLLQNLGGFRLHNWWALFILIPAFGSLSAAYRSYQENKRLNAAGRGSLIMGLIFVFVACIFLFSLSWGLMWPILLVLFGLSLLISALFPG